MADAEIEIKATADAAEAQQQLERTASAIERVAVAVQDAAERLRTFDLSPLSEALASFESSAARTKSLSGAVEGWREEVESAKASAEETVDAIGELSLRLEDVAQGLRDGSMSSEQAIAATQKIRDEYKALSTESQEFRQAVRELYGDLQSASAVAAAAAEKEGQAAEKSLQKIEQASERKRRARELEAQSAEALREKLEALRREEEAARSSGNMPAAADAAQQAAAVEQALQRRSAAEQRAADREEQIASRRQTRLSLEGKSYVELARHLKVLVAAREEAAQAGDGEAYDQLTARIKETRAAVEDLTTRTNIARTAMLGKAQAGMMVADQLGQLANGFRDGSVSAAGFATTIMSVGMAIKAGLGSIGWAMAAVQALQMALDYFVGSKISEANQKAIQDAEATAQRYERFKREIKNLELETQNAQKQAAEDRYRREISYLQRLEDEWRISVEKRKASEDRDFAEREAQIRHEYELRSRQNKIDLAERIITAEEAARRERELAEDFSEQERKLRIERTENRKKEAEDNLEFAKRQAQINRNIVAEQYKGLEDLLHLDLPELKEIQEIKYELRQNIDDARRDQLERRQEALTADMVRIADMLSEAGLVYEGGLENGLKLAISLQDEYRAHKATAEAAERRVEQAQEDLEEAEYGLVQTRQRVEHERRLSNLESRQVRAVDAEARQKESIKAELERICATTKTTGNYILADLRSQAEKLAYDRALLKARLSELRQAQLSAQEAGAGPETIKQINEKMRATRNALSGLEQSAREAAIEVLRSLNKDKEGASVDLVAMLRRDQVKVDRAAEKIARQADAAARYLDAAATARRAGDQDAEERYYAAYERRIAGMQKLGATVDRMTVTGDMGTAEVQRLLGNLRIQEQVQMRRNRAGLRLADSEERQAQRAQRDAAASRVQAPARPGGAEAAPAPAAQEEQYRAEVAQLRQAAESLREQNWQMGGFVTQCTKALGDMTASCRAMADQLASATGQIAAVQQQMRNVNASMRATARGAV